ncbi:MAG: flagellar export protein FliJ [Planctomycetota bacterium]|nr:MAG: flagellar export protein FliJ [Planctomycetota bacterium]
MAVFRFRLQPLQRLREHARDQRRAELAQALEALELVEQKQRELAEELERATGLQRQAAKPGSIDVDTIMAVRRYQMALYAQAAQLQQQAAAIAEEIERRREALAQADREVRVLEKLRERQLERYRSEEQRREMKVMDETAAQRYLRQENE